MRRKWKDARGETLIEVLAAILIGALSVTLLFGAVMASGNLDQDAKAADEALNKALELAEKQDTPVADAAIVPTAEVTVANDSGSVPLLVKFYGGEGALSYRLEGVTPP